MNFPIKVSSCYKSYRIHGTGSYAAASYTNVLLTPVYDHNITIHQRFMESMKSNFWKPIQPCRSEQQHSVLANPNKNLRKWTCSIQFAKLHLLLQGLGRIHYGKVGTVKINSQQTNTAPGNVSKSSKEIRSILFLAGVMMCTQIYIYIYN